MANLSTWSGGFQWTITFVHVTVPLLLLSSPAHNLFPHEASLEIFPKICNGCFIADGLKAYQTYFIRSRVVNELGFGAYSDTVVGIPKASAEPPSNVSVRVISGNCLEVSFEQPLSSSLDALADISSYVIQWDFSSNFINSRKSSSSCVSQRFGSCLHSSTVNPMKHEFCGLLLHEKYFVRVAAINSVLLHINSLRWSPLKFAIPEDLPPGPPSFVNAYALGRNSIGVMFAAPERDGGRPILGYNITWATDAQFVSKFSIYVSVSILRHASGGTLAYYLQQPVAALITGIPYFIRVSAVNNLGTGDPADSSPIKPTGPPEAPTLVLASTGNLEGDSSDVTVSWCNLSDEERKDGLRLDGFVVEWWSLKKLSEVQVVKVTSSRPLLATTFTLSYSTSPLIKRETAALPWNASPELLRRELMNLGWDEIENIDLIRSVCVTRSSLSIGFAWSITFDCEKQSTWNEGDQVQLSGSLSQNGDIGNPEIVVTTSINGRRQGGRSEVQFLQVVGTGNVFGFYRLKFDGSEYTAPISVDASILEIKMSLEQLQSIGEVVVVQNDSADPIEIGTSVSLVHHYEISFVSNIGNLQVMHVDDTGVFNYANDAAVIIHDGDNNLDDLGFKKTSTVPGETPLDFSFSEVLGANLRSFTVTGLTRGDSYVFSVHAINVEHGIGPRSIATPNPITPPVIVPDGPKNVTLSVNHGHGDSLLVTFSSPENDGGSPILSYRVEVDIAPTFDRPFIREIECASNNKHVVWQIQTLGSGGKISGGSFRLKLNLNGRAQITTAIPYDAVASAWDENGVEQEITQNFDVTDGSDMIVASRNIEDMVFSGDRLRFSGQTEIFQYYVVSSVSGQEARLTRAYNGITGTQVWTKRIYGGKGTPVSSRIYCTLDANLCPELSLSQSGSVQNKLRNIRPPLMSGVLVERDGPDATNGFLWRVTFLDEWLANEDDFSISVHTNSLTLVDENGSAEIKTFVIEEGRSHGICEGSFVVPELGGLVQGLKYFARVSAYNAVGYSLPRDAETAESPKVVPSPPTGVVLDVGISSSELRVTFGQPYSNGGDLITSYMIEWSRQPTFLPLDGFDSLYYLAGGSPYTKTIIGLKKGVNYYVRVKAKNSEGYGPSQTSLPAFLNPHQYSSPPRAVKVGATSDTMLTVGWDAPSDNGGDNVKLMRIEWDESSTFASLSFPPHKGYIDIDAALHQSYTIELLNPTKSYYVRVLAINSAGKSLPALAKPSPIKPSKQVPGVPEAVFAAPGALLGEVIVRWERPVVPHHLIPCKGLPSGIGECPRPYGGGDPTSDGGDEIEEWEVEWSERPDFGGGFSNSLIVPGRSVNVAFIQNLIEGRYYYVRVLARNQVGSGAFSRAYQVVLK